MAENDSFIQVSWTLAKKEIFIQNCDRSQSCISDDEHEETKQNTNSNINIDDPRAQLGIQNSRSAGWST